MTKVKNDKFAHESEWLNWIGQKIEKHSGKPFKSSFKFGIPDRMELNPNSGKMAFHMSEDDTLVDCHQCKLASKCNDCVSPTEDVQMCHFCKNNDNFKPAQ